MNALDEALRQRISRHLTAHERAVGGTDGLRPAAVAIVLTEGPDGEATFVLTRRSPRMRAHSRQYALPGGRLDPGETAVDAGRRELAEEVGMVVGTDAVLGCLDDYATRSGHLITPVVIFADGDHVLSAHEPEVDEIHLVPLSELERDDSPRWVEIAESEKPVIQLPILNRLIHAPTAALLWQFAEVGLQGRTCRTDGVEEPVWAWR